MSGSPHTVWSSRPLRSERQRNVERLILIPVFDDWDVVSLLLQRVDDTLRGASLAADVLLIDDGSTVSPDSFSCPALVSLRTVDILRLRRNLGHQRALAIGLSYAEHQIDPEIVIIMDGDGEDDPQDIPRMLAKADEVERAKIVFAERKRRSEPLAFRFFYRLYLAAHYLLTGHGVRVGNYSVVPRVALARLVVLSELWNHYAAAVVNARLGYTMVPTKRAKRLAGRSRMNFVSLVVHGLSALSVYSHIIGVRILIASGALVSGAALAFLAIVLVRLESTGPQPGWLVYAVAAIFALLVQAVTVAVLFVFLVLSARQGSSFIPLRDYTYFIDRVTRVRE